MLPPSWRATLRAVDGTTTSDVFRQFSSVPADATHLVLSLGGNDTLMNSDLLGARLESSAAGLALFGERLSLFDAAYRRAVTALAERRLDLTVCTIYNGALEPDQAQLATVALMMFNDVIARAALDHATRLIELRAVCGAAADYANPIEPSGTGGRKIAQAIARAVGALPGEVALQVYAG